MPGIGDGQNDVPALGDIPFVGFQVLDARVYSDPGHGTSVRIYLPKTEKEAEEAAPITGMHQTIPSGDERILLVDDDHAVRRTVARLLASLGYAVVEASNGMEALSRFEQAGPFDLVLTDIIMPGGMSGLELAQRVRGLDASVKVLLTSGYTDTTIFAHGVLGPGDHVLNKPYRKSELARKVRWMLDGGASAAGSAAHRPLEPMAPA